MYMLEPIVPYRYISCLLCSCHRLIVQFLLINGYEKFRNVVHVYGTYEVVFRNVTLKCDVVLSLLTIFSNNLSGANFLI